MEGSLSAATDARDRGQGAIACIGFMGAGKTTAAAALAQLRGSPFVDVDREIERRWGKPVARVFAEDGEAAFRELEQRVTLELLQRGDRPVLALGGGAIGSPDVRRALAQHLVVWIDIELDEAWSRCEGSGRPLARDRGEFADLYAARAPIYAELADAVIPASRSRAIEPAWHALDAIAGDAKLIWATSASGDYPVYIGDGLLSSGFWPAQIAGRRFLISDGNVARLYAESLPPLAGRVVIMPGEQSKTIAHAEIVWTELARAGMTRQDLLLALGGGVIGDLGGFCAATYQRGVRYVQLPTTLVAQVDSAYGGKTGVDLTEAKNYVGAYHQPTAVIADTAALRTLPSSELAAGYAEVVKTALIAGGGLWELIRGGGDPTDPEVITACVRCKLAIVAKDERDAGLRQVLNLGHTVGHAIEAATGYARYRHGEAVALGLLAALRLSELPELRDEVRSLLAARGLPTRLEGVDPDAVVMATARDKKRLGEAAVPFVLLERPGEPRPGRAVAGRDLIAAVRELERG